MLGDFDILAREHRFTRREHFYVLADPLGRIVGENAVLGKNALEFKTARRPFLPKSKVWFPSTIILAINMLFLLLLKR